jgi:hypothetical protein
MFLVFILLRFLFVINDWFRKLYLSRKPFRFGRRTRLDNSKSAKPHGYRFLSKPDWVLDEVIRLKAHLTHEGCRTVALTFNRIHGHTETVSKSYVAKVIRKHRYGIELERKAFRAKVPYSPALNAIWGADLTGKQDAHGVIHNIFGIVDHGSRLAVALRAVKRLNT